MPQPLGLELAGIEPERLSAGSADDVTLESLASHHLMTEIGASWYPGNPTCCSCCTSCCC